MANDHNYDMSLVNNVGNDLIAAFNDGYAHGKAEAERKRGEWQPLNSLVNKCTNCGEKYWFYLGIPFNFCPNCGADMRGESDV
mgnify:CR=1 FL=1